MKVKDKSDFKQVDKYRYIKNDESKPIIKNEQRVDVDNIVVELDDWVKITTRLYKGKKWIDIRKFYFDRNDRKKKPSKKGITLAAESWERLREIEPLIDKALRDLDSFTNLNNQ